MATFSQLPATLNLEFVRGDSLSVEVDFEQSLVGYSLTALLVSVVSGATVRSLTATAVSAASGIVAVSLTTAETAEIPAGTYAWELSWVSGAVSRKALTGFVEVRNR
jgi:hypothetical protein